MISFYLIFFCVSVDSKNNSNTFSQNPNKIALNVCNAEDDISEGSKTCIVLKWSGNFTPPALEMQSHCIRRSSVNSSVNVKLYLAR